MTAKKAKPPSNQLKYDPKNLRIHNERNKSVIKQSLLDTGPFRSIAVDRDGIIRAGNGVYEQASALGYTVRIVDSGPNELIAVRRPDLFGRRAERAGLADNHSSDTSEMDNLALAQIAANDRQFLEGLYSADEISSLASLIESQNPAQPPSENDTSFDYADQYQEKWKTAVGQTWEMPSATVHNESHRLYVGDIRDMPGLYPHTGCITSPPYAEQRAAKYGGIAPDKYVAWWEAVQARIGQWLNNDGVFFLNLKAHAEAGERVIYVTELVLAMKQKWGWKYIDDFVWVKPGYPGDMGKRFKNGHEPIYMFAKSLDYKFRLENVLEHRDSNFGGYVENLEHIQGETGTDNSHDLSVVRPSNVLHISPDKTTNESSGGHPARFPPALPEFFIRAYSDAGDRWLDPFGGSGTTLVVCEQTGRLCTIVELLPKYAATILERFSNYSGTIPRLISAPTQEKRIVSLSSRTVAKARLEQMRSARTLNKKAPGPGAKKRIISRNEPKRK